MKLTELEPAWIHPNIFVFLCPHCRGIILSCKNVVMSNGDQWNLFRRLFGKEHNRITVHCREDQAWNISSRDFETMTVSPSIDASPAGHWHGHIQNGQVT